MPRARPKLIRYPRLLKYTLTALTRGISRLAIIASAIYSGAISFRLPKTPTSRDKIAPAAAASLIICFNVTRPDRSAMPAAMGWSTADRTFPAAISAPIPAGLIPLSNRKTEA